MLIQTTTFSIYRGTTENEYGSEVPNTTSPLYQGIPGAIVEGLSQSTSPESGRQYAVLTINAHIEHGSDIRNGDYIRDETNEYLYEVLDTAPQPQVFINAPTRLSLRKVEA